MILAQGTSTVTNTTILIGAIVAAVGVIGDRVFTYVKVFLSDRRLRDAEDKKAEYLKDIRDSNRSLATEMTNLNNNMVKLQVTSDERHAANIRFMPKICPYNKPATKQSEPPEV